MFLKLVKKSRSIGTSPNREVLLSTKGESAPAVRTSGQARRVEWRKAEDIDSKIKKLINSLNLDWVKKGKIYSFRSKKSKTRAYARIWGLSRIWQNALGANPSYIIEVISEKFDKLDSEKQDKILLHELAHIPKNFSGSLIPHIRRRGKRNFEDKVDNLVAQYNKLKYISRK